MFVLCIREQGRRRQLVRNRKLRVVSAAAGAVILLASAWKLPVRASEYDIPGVETLQEQSIKVIGGDSGGTDSGVWEEAGEDENGVETDRIYILKRHYSAYDADTDDYILYCGETEVHCNMPPDSLISSKTGLSINAPEGISASLYRNGEAVGSLSGVTEAGNYVLQLSDSIGNSNSYEFIILSEMVNNLTEFWVPRGFEIDFIEWNGQPLTLIYTDYYKFSVDGTFKIGWQNQDIEKYYTTEFTLDREPPTLTLNGVVNGQASNVVTFSDLEEGAGVAYELDGEFHQVTKLDEEMTRPGNYRLMVYDAAGNYTIYEFVIHTYLNGSAYIALAMIFGAVIGLFAYSRWLRKHMRVG